MVKNRQSEAQMSGRGTTAGRTKRIKVPSFSSVP